MRSALKVQPENVKGMPEGAVVHPHSKEGFVLPDTIAYLADEGRAAGVRKQVGDALREHVVNPPDNIYKPGEETVETHNGKVKITVKERQVRDGGEPYLTVMETIVEPEDASQVQDNQIVLGGYSVNTPYYYRDYIPLAQNTRWVFINILGGGTQDYVDRDKKISWLGGSTDFLENYTKEAGLHIQALIDELSAANPSQTFSLTGESMGGLVMENLLAMGKYLPTEYLGKISRMFLDAPVPSTPLPFTGGSHLLSILRTCFANGYARVPLGLPSSLNDKFLGKLMTSDLYAKATPEANGIITDTREACFSGTGVFPQVVFTLRRDPMLELMDSTDDADRARQDALRGLNLHVFFRPGDKTVPAAKIIEMVKTWKAAGLNIMMTPGQAHSNSHLHLPGLSFSEIYKNDGVNGRFQPPAPIAA